MDLSIFAPLRPVVVGPRANLRRYSVPAEKTFLAAYDPVTAADYAWPGLAAGETVDLAYAKLYVDDALLNYFNKYIGSGGSAQASTTYPNRVRAANYVFKTANGAARSAAFYDRDVRVGDVVKLRGTVSSVTYTLNTLVTGFVGEPVAAVVNTLTADANNAANQSASASVSQVAGTPVNDVTATVNGAGYNSLVDGYLSRVYTVTVTQSSTGGNAATGRLRVRSADGLDDADNVVPAAFASPTAIGSRGLTMTLSITPAHSSASSFGLDEDDLLVGQQWRVEVHQAFTAPAPVKGGAYAGAENTTYIVTVNRGGTATTTPGHPNNPTIIVTTTTGYDASGPADVYDSGTPIVVGTHGVTVEFDVLGLRAGDVYYIPVVAASEGAVKTLVLRDDVPAQIRGVEIDVRLFIEQDGVDLSKVRTLPTTATNWSADADGIHVEDGIYLTDPTLTNAGALVAVPLDSGLLYAHFRAWTTQGAAAPVRLSAQSAVAAALGTVDPDNPLAYGVYLALGNTAGALLTQPSKDTSTTTDVVIAVPVGGDPADAALWDTALEALEGLDDAYSIVPLTHDPAVHAAVAAHVAAQSVDEIGFYRSGWVSPAADEEDAIVGPGTTTDGLVATATITATPATSPTKYTTLTSSANARFVTLGVRAGDVVRTTYSFDVEGTETYTEYVVASVTSETTLLLVTGPVGPVGVAARYEIWRTFTKAELVTQLTSAAADLADRRMRVVWPDQVGVGGATVPGYFLAAGLAGLAGTVPSHQSLQNVGPAGFDDLTRSSDFFTPTQLNSLAAGGLFVVSQTTDGTPYVRAAVTADPSAVATRDEMPSRNEDAMRFAAMSVWGEYEGPANVTGELSRLMESALDNLAVRLKANNVVRALGAPISEFRLNGLTQSTTDPTVVTASITLVGATPVNNIVVTIPISTS
jgi:hypothetical protein